MEIDDYLFYYVSFDLNQKALEKYYPKVSSKSAYQDLNKFFNYRNFEHEQGSCYSSKEPLTKKDWYVVQVKLFSKMPWLRFCANKINVTMTPQKQISYNVLEEVNKFCSKENLDRLKDDLAIAKNREIKVSRWRKL